VGVRSRILKRIGRFWSSIEKDVGSFEHFGDIGGGH